MYTKNDIANHWAFTPPSEYLKGISGAKVREQIKAAKYNTDTKATLAYKKSQTALLKKRNTYLEKMERKIRVQIYYRMTIIQKENNAQYPELYSPVPKNILAEYEMLFSLGQCF